MVGRIIPVIALHQHRSVRVDAEEIGSASDPVNLLLRKLGQARPRKSLLLAQIVNTVDHLLGIVAGLGENRVCEPT